MRIQAQSNTKIVARDNGKIVGYVTFGHPHDDSKKRNLEIRFVYVAPTFRRQGIATMLLTTLLKRYHRKVTWVSLWTWTETERDGSWKLYKKLGFKQLAIEKDYYEQGVPTRLFAKRIDT